MGAIDEVKERTDIVDVISQYTKLTKSGKNFRGLCPFHTEKDPSFFVYPEQQSWHCFGACSTGGDVLSFVMKKENMPFGDALRLLAERVGVTLPSIPGEGEGKAEKEARYQINEAAAHYYHNLLLNASGGAAAKKYVASRGFSEDIAKQFQLGFSPNNWEDLKNYLMEKGYAPEKMLETGLIIASEDGRTRDRFRNRLMFPIFDIRGHIIGFGARALDDTMPKYLNSPQSEIFDKSSTLYGLNFASSAIRQQELAVIVEGYIDVITAHQHGFTNVVASMGTAITEVQVRALKKLGRNLLLALDADAAGEEAMRRCIQYENVLDAEIRVLIMPDGKDPDDFIKEDPTAWQKMLGAAIPIMDYTFSTVASSLDLNTAKGKSQATDELLPIIDSITNPVRQAYYLQKLASLVGVPQHTIEVAYNRMKSRPVSRKRYTEATTATPKQSINTKPREEYLLALLLQHPELKQNKEKPNPEYFQDSTNREIFLAWQQSDSTATLKEKLEPILQEYIDKLSGIKFQLENIETRYLDSLMRLRQEHYRNQAAVKEEMLRSAGTGADLALLEELGIENDKNLLEIYKLGHGRPKEMRK
ncbi:DNA primase [Chloroflexota bacterium]